VIVTGRRREHCIVTGCRWPHDIDPLECDQYKKIAKIDMPVTIECRGRLTEGTGEQNQITKHNGTPAIEVDIRCRIGLGRDTAAEKSDHRCHKPHDTGCDKSSLSGEVAVSHSDLRLKTEPSRPPLRNRV